MSTTPATINIYQAILSDLATGALQPGQRLGEESLGMQWNVSRMPVREAFLRLEAEGLVERRPNHGTYIREIDRAELMELMELRLLIESHIVRHVAVQATSRELDELEALATIADTAGSQSTVSDCVKVETDFHFRLGEIARLRHTFRLLKVSHLLTRSFMMEASAAPISTEPLHVHQDMVDILRLRDPEAAAREMHRHITLSINALSAGKVDTRPPTPPTEPRTASSDIYERFLSELRAGAIAPGDRVADASLAAKWHVSRAPIREALVRLEVEGFVERRPRAGTFVRQPDPHEMRELITLRKLTECHVARKAAMYATDDELRELLPLADAADRVGEHRSVAACVKAETDFHFRLCEIARLRHTLRVLRTSQLLTRSFWLSSHAVAGAPAPSHAHRELIEVIRQRNPDDAARAMEQHVAQSLLAALTSPAPTSPHQ